MKIIKTMRDVKALQFGDSYSFALPDDPIEAAEAMTDKKVVRLQAAIDKKFSE